MTKANKLKLRRIGLEIKESELIQTGKEMAESILENVMDSTVAALRLRKQAQLFLRRHKAANKIRLYLTIDKVSDAAETIDRMVPDVPKRGLLV